MPKPTTIKLNTAHVDAIRTVFRGLRALRAVGDDAGIYIRAAIVRLLGLWQGQELPGVARALPLIAAAATEARQWERDSYARNDALRAAATPEAIASAERRDGYVTNVLAAVDAWRDHAAETGADFDEHVRTLLGEFAWRLVDPAALRGALAVLMQTVPVSETADLSARADTERAVLAESTGVQS